MTLKVTAARITDLWYRGAAVLLERQYDGFQLVPIWRGTYPRGFDNGLAVELGPRVQVHATPLAAYVHEETICDTPPL